MFLPLLFFLYAFFPLFSDGVPAPRRNDRSMSAEDGGSSRPILPSFLFIRLPRGSLVMQAARPRRRGRSRTSGPSFLPFFLSDPTVRTCLSESHSRPPRPLASSPWSLSPPPLRYLKSPPPTWRGTTLKALFNCSLGVHTSSTPHSSSLPPVHVAVSSSADEFVGFSFLSLFPNPRPVLKPQTNEMPSCFALFLSPPDTRFKVTDAGPYREGSDRPLSS